MLRFRLQKIMQIGQAADPGWIIGKAKPNFQCNLLKSTGMN